MTLPYRPFEKVRCPTCQRVVAAETSGESLRLLKHRMPSGVGGAWCDASEKVIVRTVSGSWQLQK